ncbi:MAG: class I SAM-dependent methyltransferase [Proteobacteria bacterium]|nr:MAG: class I SAM-dependent methyltransferase [Pseudomonadota bacterium]
MAGKDDRKAKKKPAGKTKSRGPKYTARTADKYELYQLSVQSPEPDIEFIRRVYKKQNGRAARHFREDFSGTGLLTAEWIKKGAKYTAEAFDIDPEPVEWGRRRHFAELGEAAERATLHLKDVREPSDRKPDVRCAQNFSYWIFKTRAGMLDYFRRVLEDLGDDGVFVLDAHGGPESIEEREESTRISGGFTYVWDQHWFSPVTHEATMYIHFRFKDGSEMKRAFAYEWRVWSIPELRDILLDAGFSRVDVYWEGTAEDGETGNGIYRKTRYGTNDPAWVTYIVAIK